MENTTAIFDNIDNTTVESGLDPEMDELFGKLNQVQLIVTPTLMLLGITGNLMIIITVSGQHFVQLSTKYTLKALAVSDSVLLLTNVFNQHFTRSVFGCDVRALSPFSCKLFFVAYRVGKMSASWFIVLVAVERFVAVLFPFHVRIVTTKRNIIIAIVCIYVYNIVISGIWTVSSDVINNTCLPDAITPDNASIHKIFVIIGGLSYSLVPILILLFITPPIVYKLLVQRRRRQELTHNALQRSTFTQNVSRITAMLIGIVLWYIVCVIPITLVLVLTFWTNKSIFESQDKSLIIFTTVAQTFEQINHSSNFFIYVMLSQQFRERFLQKIRCKKDVVDIQQTILSSYLERISNNTM